MMKKSGEEKIYDLAIIGNGIAAQTFLWNLSREESKSQNFSIAHIYSEHMAPACTLQSSATVSLNGIEEDVSPLGNDMREGYYLFDELFNKFRPDGVERVNRVVVGTNESDLKKLTRRYKQLDEIISDKFKSKHLGKEYPSYLISPVVFSHWLNSQICILKDDYKLFAKNIEKIDELYIVYLENGSALKARKVLFSTGAFAKIFERFFAHNKIENLEEKNTIKAGCFLHREVDLKMDSFYLSIDGHLILYRNNENEKKLIIGNITMMGAYEAPNFAELDKLLSKLESYLTFSLGKLSDFKTTTGLRHKGPKRLLIAEAIDEKNTLFRINGLYKNGYTLSLVAAKRMLEMIKVF